MNILSVMQRFPDQEACFALMEQVRFGDPESPSYKPYCPLCGSTQVARKAD